VYIRVGVDEYVRERERESERKRKRERERERERNFPQRCNHLHSRG